MLLVGLMYLILLNQNEMVVDNDQCFPIIGKYAASHILITWDGASMASASITRTKKEALEIANEIAAILREHPDQFEELAETRSDDLSSKQSGYLGGFGPQDMVNKFFKAVKKLKVGEISPEPVKTEYGFHIIRRESLTPPHYSCDLFLLSYKGAKSLKNLPRERVGDRNREEAFEMITQYRQEMTPENFEELHSKYSDFKQRNGFLGVFTHGRGPLYRVIRMNLEKTPIGELTPVFELPAGFAIAKRLRVEKFAGSRILICFVECKNCPTYVRRSKEEARTLAEDLVNQIIGGKANFEETAETYSNEPFGIRGGKLPNWFPGTMDSRFERVFSSLKEGQTSPSLVETNAGFFILRRDVYSKN